MDDSNIEVKVVCELTIADIEYLRIMNNVLDHRVTFTLHAINLQLKRLMLDWRPDPAGYRKEVRNIMANIFKAEDEGVLPPEFTQALLGACYKIIAMTQQRKGSAK